MEAFCQWALVAMFIIRYLTRMNAIINGLPAEKPSGMPGFIGTTLGIITVGLFLYGAGALDNLL